MFDIIKRIKFNGYCTKFSKWFDEEKPKYGNINYKKLIDKIYIKYNDMDDKQRITEEILLKDKINEYSFGKIDISVFVSIILTFITYISIESFKDSDITTFMYVLKVFLLMTIYFLAVQMFSICSYTINKGFYTLCLDTLSKVNNTLLEIAVEKEDDKIKNSLKDIE